MLTPVKLLFSFRFCYVCGMTDTEDYISRNSIAAEFDTTAGVPELVQLIPYGLIKGRDGRQFKMFNTKAVIAETIRRFNPSGAQNKIDLVMDYEHQTDLSAENGKPAPAGGWIKELFDKGFDGLWGKVCWTAEAKEFIKNRQYRFLSPVFKHDKEGNVLALLRAGLTNAPNLELKAFNSDKLNFMEVDVLKTELCTLLGLPDTAADEDVIAAVKKLSEPEADPESLNKIAAAAGAKSADAEDILLAINTMRTGTVDAKTYAALNKEVEELKAERLKDKAETAVNKAVEGGLLPPALKDKALDMYANMGAEYFESFIAGLPKVAVNKETPATGTSKEDKLSDEALAMCKAMGIEPNDYLKTLKDEEV